MLNSHKLDAICREKFVNFRSIGQFYNRHEFTRKLSSFLFNISIRNNDRGLIYSAHRIFFELYFRERKRNQFENANHRYIILTILNKINKVRC